MTPRKRPETRAEWERRRADFDPREPWEDTKFSALPNGQMHAYSFGFNVTAQMVEFDGRLRPVALAVTPLDTFPVQHFEPLTPRVLAGVPLVALETVANLPAFKQVMQMTSDEYDAEEAEDARFLEFDFDPAPLELPDEEPYPEYFWERVAARYLRLVIVDGVRNPAVWIAEEAEVEPATVRGWIARCRDKGLIAPGTRGRVG